MNRHRPLALALAALLLAGSGNALATPLHAPPTPPGVQVPTWNELTPQQREKLGHLAGRWDQLPASRRVHALERLDRQQRWDAMTPQQRDELRQGARHFREMPPEQRQQMRQSIETVRRMPPEEQRRLRETWRSLSPEQRRAWLEAGGPGKAPPPKH